jgi:hypothetical protein
MIMPMADALRGVVDCVNLGLADGAFLGSDSVDILGGKLLRELIDANFSTATDVS